MLKLPRQEAIRIKVAIDRLIENPRPAGCKKIKGSENSYRIRIGSYRVVYLIVDSLLIVTIIRIAHRKDVYR